MREYYEQQDIIDRRRYRDQARQKFNEIIMNHKKFVLAEQKLEEEAKAAAGEEKKARIEEENANKKQMDKLQGWEEKYTELMNNRVRLQNIDPKD